MIWTNQEKMTPSWHVSISNSRGIRKYRILLVVAVLLSVNENQYHQEMVTSVTCRRIYTHEIGNTAGPWLNQTKPHRVLKSL